MATFNHATHVILPFTTDSGAIGAALAKPPALAQGTHIYDAVGEGVSLIDRAGLSVGTIVVQGSFYLFDLCGFPMIRMRSLLVIRVFQSLGLSAVVLALIFHIAPQMLVGIGDDGLAGEAVTSLFGNHVDGDPTALRLRRAYVAWPAEALMDANLTRRFDAVQAQASKFRECTGPGDAC